MRKIFSPKYFILFIYKGLSVTVFCCGIADFHIPIRIYFTNLCAFAPLRDFIQSILRSSLTTHRSLLLSTFFLLLTTSSHSTILTVKQDGTGEHTRIQDAINAASVNDTILVWPGTYYENITFCGKDLVLASLYMTTNDRQYIINTIIDGNKNGCVITLQNQETLASVVCGFTIQNGKKDFSTSNWNKYGCGIMLFQSSLQIRNNVIQNNEAYAGGGLCSLDGVAKLYGNIIKHNHSYFSGGGIYYSNGVYPVFFDNEELNSVFCNYGHMGCDISVKSTEQIQIFYFDTLMVSNPDMTFVLSTDNYYQPVNDLIVHALNSKIEPIPADLYVSPKGNNSNSGITESDPLKSISYAILKVMPDSLIQRTIHILPGVYSPSSSDEKLPVCGRSNISLSGYDRNNTLIDCQNNGFFYSSWYMQNVLIKNLTILNGFGALLSPTFLTDGGIQAMYSNRVRISDVSILNTQNALTQCIYCHFPDSVFLTNFKCLNGTGVQANLFLRNMDSFPMHLRVENIRIHGNRYYDDGTGLFGGYKNLVIVGGNENNETVTAKVINAEITDNVSFDTWMSSNNGAGFAISKRAKLDLVNATIGGNRDSTNLPGTSSTVESSNVNIYNSVFYNNNSPDLFIYGDNNVNDPAEINFHYTLFENGPDGIIDGPGNTIINWGKGILDEDPQWDSYGANPYTLLSSSPCINTGTPMYEEGMDPPYIKEENGKYILYTHEMDTIHLPATDLAGNPRIAYGR
nr:hypothetical protein [Bacteroidota bacterium]